MLSSPIQISKTILRRSSGSGQYSMLVFACAPGMTASSSTISLEIRLFTGELNQAHIDHIHYSGLYPVIGWVLHYVPFAVMARVTYVHHYYPALYYAILTFGFCVDWLTQKLNAKALWLTYALLYAMIIGTFVYFRVIVFGIEGSSQQWAHLSWLSGWRISN